MFKLKHLLFHVSRILLGVIFLGAGINGYFVILQFDPFIPTSPEAMALFEFHYLLVAEKTLEVICGVLLLCNRFVPLAVALLAPLIANIVLLHIFLDHSLLPLAIVLLLLHIYLLFYYKNNFIKLLEKQPSVP
ncbi:hypothetical protein ACERJO_00715 [Halalkalibacter sp. AB-rgal2]|uniref:hypothetical protein n=1 Tax=Halalkalibacter sp. AB-rgal2 TaxID=3242695 RepID=UPI00359D8E14